MKQAMTMGDVRRELEETIAKLEPFARPLAERLHELAKLARESGAIGKKRAPVALVRRAIPAGDHADVQARAQLLFTGTNLWIDAKCAPWFEVVDLKVGKSSQRVDVSSNIPATAFAIGLDALALEDAERAAAFAQWPLEAAEPGMLLTLTVRNRDTAHRDFEGVLWGAYEDY
ncbi:MAG: hypothetical protein ACHREM_28865 [Polyangiales bacterium]